MLHSVYFKPLVDLENKNCERVPLEIILPECELNHCCRDGLKKPFQWFGCSFTRTTFTRHLKGFLQDPKIFKSYIRHSYDIYLRVALLHNSCFLNQPVTFSKRTVTYHDRKNNLRHKICNYIFSLNS